jgi:hypothetical protein
MLTKAKLNELFAESGMDLIAFARAVELETLKACAQICLSHDCIECMEAILERIEE